MESFSPTFCVFPIIYPHFIFGTLGSGGCDRCCLEGGLPILTPYAPNIQFKFAWPTLQNPNYTFNLRISWWPKVIAPYKIEGVLTQWKGAFRGVKVDDFALNNADYEGVDLPIMRSNDNNECIVLINV